MKTRNFVEYIKQMLTDDPELAEMVEEEAINSHIAEQIHRCRKEHGLTQKQLAEKVGMTQSQIARLENADNESPTLSTLRRVAKGLGKKVRVEFYAASATETFTFNVVQNEQVEVKFNIEQLVPSHG